MKGEILDDVEVGGRVAEKWGCWMSFHYIRASEVKELKKQGQKVLGGKSGAREEETHENGRV